MNRRQMLEAEVSQKLAAEESPHDAGAVANVIDAGRAVVVDSLNTLAAECGDAIAAVVYRGLAAELREAA